jgi:ribbon-helix-helix protein
MPKNNRLVNRKKLGNAIDLALYNELDELQKETRIPKSKLLDEAIELLLKKYGKTIQQKEDT